MRAALGAGRERIVRQIVTESILLSIVGGGRRRAGRVSSRCRRSSRLVPDTLPIARAAERRSARAAFAGALVLLTGLAFSVIPALKAAGAKSLAAVREDARSSSGAKQRVRSALVILEVTASVVLLISSGLLVRAMWRLQAVDPGFKAENVLTLRTALPWPKYDDPKARHPFYRRFSTTSARFPESRVPRISVICRWSCVAASGPSS